jgi:hypothetical protein
MKANSNHYMLCRPRVLVVLYIYICMSVLAVMDALCLSINGVRRRNEDHLLGKITERKEGGEDKEEERNKIKDKT